MTFRKWMLTSVLILLIVLVAFGAIQFISSDGPNESIAEHVLTVHPDMDSFVIGGPKSAAMSSERLSTYLGGARFRSISLDEADFAQYEKLINHLGDHYQIQHILLHIDVPEVDRFDFSTSDIESTLREEGLGHRGQAEAGSKPIDDLEKYRQTYPQYWQPMSALSVSATDHNVAALERIKAYCEAKGIDFRVMTAATSVAEMERYEDVEQLKSYWRKLAEVTDFWDFSGYTTVSLDPRHFADPMRYGSWLGEMMLGRMFADPEVFVPSGFGHWTTRDNVDEHVERLFTKPTHTGWADRSGEARVPILMYHHFVTDPELENAASVSPQKFENDMIALKQAGYETVSLQDLIDYVHTGKALPERPVVITFDDGYLSNYEYAFPVLRRLDMKATIFVIGWSVGETKYKGTDRDIIPHFTWEQAREMAESGLIDIQHHTYDMHNPNSPEEPSRRGVTPLPGESSGAYARALADDVLKLEQLIEEHVGRPVFALAYPYGEYRFLSELVLQDLGYEVTLSTKKGIQTVRQGDPLSLYAMKRINVGPELSSDELMRLLQE